MVRAFYQKHGPYARGPNAELIAAASPVLAVLNAEHKIRNKDIQVIMHKPQLSPSMTAGLPKLESLQGALWQLKEIAQRFLVPYLSPYTEPDASSAWMPEFRRHLGYYALMIQQYRNSEPPEQFNPGFLSIMGLLQAHQWVFTILSRVLPCSNETAFDPCFPSATGIEKTKYEMNAVSGHVQETPFVQGGYTEYFGFVPHGFFVVSKLRHAKLRRDSLDIMRKITPTKDIWSPAVVVALGTQIMQIEERGLENPEISADVLESSRIRAVNVRIDMKKQEANLQYIKHPYTIESPVYEEGIPDWPWQDFQDFNDQKAQVCSSANRYI